jgi:hypothetical protein
VAPAYGCHGHQRKAGVPPSCGCYKTEGAYTRHRRSPGSATYVEVFSHQQVTTIFDIEVLRKYSEMVPDAPKCISLVFEQISAAKRQLREESL